MDHFKLLQRHINELSNPAHFYHQRAAAISDIVQAGGHVEFHSPQGRSHVNVKLGEFQGAVIGREGQDPWPVFIDAMKLSIRSMAQAAEWVKDLSREYGSDNVTNTGIHDRRAGYCIEVTPDWFLGHFSVLPAYAEVWAWMADGQQKYTKEPIEKASVSDIIEYINGFEVKT